jgi:hypothetical protein
MLNPRAIAVTSSGGYTTGEVQTIFGKNSADICSLLHRRWRVVEALTYGRPSRSTIHDSTVGRLPSDFLFGFAGPDETDDDSREQGGFIAQWVASAEA